MALTPEQMKAREGKLTASGIAPLMTGEPVKLYALWQQCTGDPSYSFPDLSNVWPVQLGSHTESLNLDWYERKTGHALTRRGEVVVSAHYDWAACTLDGWDSVRNCPVECKHVGGREPLARVLERYQPQMHWQMIVTGTDTVAASIIEGANEPVIEIVTFDQDYGAELLRRAITFWACVQSLTPPVAQPAMAAAVRATVSYNFEGNNEWADQAVTWLDTHRAARKAAAAEKTLKALVPADAQRAHGHGIEITRDRANRLSLRAA
jgi:predicted phage-related endonuclease